MQARKDGTLPWLRPDGKTQVTVEYKMENGACVPQRVHTVLISTQHAPDVTNDDIHKGLMKHVVKKVIPEKYLDDKTIFHMNPSGLCLPTPPLVPPHLRAVPALVSSQLLGNPPRSLPAAMCMRVRASAVTGVNWSAPRGTIMGRESWGNPKGWSRGTAFIVKFRFGRWQQRMGKQFHTLLSRGQMDQVWSHMDEIVYCPGCFDSLC